MIKYNVIIILLCVAIRSSNLAEIITNLRPSYRPKTSFLHLETLKFEICDLHYFIGMTLYCYKHQKGRNVTQYYTIHAEQLLA